MKLHLLDLSDWEMVGRVALALLLGSALGIEREIDAQPAGFRTHVVLCLGAALFGLISVHAFAPFQALRSQTNVQIDPTRVASQVVVGVGFLGGGAILKHGTNVRGLTTAASMWVAAAIGLAVGVGYYWAAVAVTVATVGTMGGLRGFRTWVRRRYGRRIEVIDIRMTKGSHPGRLLTYLHSLQGVTLRGVSITRDDVSGVTDLVTVIKTEPGVQLDPILNEIANREDVEEFTLEDTQ